MSDGYSVSSPCGENTASVPLFTELSDQEKAEYWASLALRHCPGLGARLNSRLLKFFGSALAAFENVKEWPACHIRSACMEALRKGAWRKEAKKEWDAAIKTRILLWTSSSYPQLLRDIPDAPVLLYLRGNHTLLNNPCVAIVGSRKAMPESRKVAFILGSELSKCGITIVSGMAVGIDESAHRGALNELGGSIGVLGTGINLCYPSENSELFAQMTNYGLLVSEFAPNARPQPTNFPIRNRIISGLSLGTVVVEAASKSGSLITAQLACDQNREVFAVPGAVYNTQSQGCQNLIRQGAHPVFGHDDILRELMQLLRDFSLPATGQTYVKKESNSENSKMENIPSNPFLQFDPPLAKSTQNNDTFGKVKKSPLPDLPETVKDHAQNEKSTLILECLKLGVRHIEQLVQDTGLEMNDLNAALIMLELTGHIKRLPGARFEICL